MKSSIAGNSVRILCFGASNTWGYDPRSYLGDRYPSESRWPELLAARTGWTVLNEGENGREIPHSREELLLLDRIVEAFSPDLLILDLGLNDLMRSYPHRAERAAGRMRNLLDHLIARFPGLSVLLLSPVPVRIPEETLVKEVQHLGILFRTLAEQRSVSYLDVGEPELAWDGIHLSEQGHRMLAETLQRELEYADRPE